NDNAWSEILMPPNSGFIRVKHNETYVIDWGISVFHALHCLSLLRTMLQDNLAEASAQFLHEAHIPHCIGYLTQSIICSADSSIESPWTKKDATGKIVTSGVDGVGSEHKCKDTDLLWRTVRSSLGPWTAYLG
ncbi:hypothetical protein DL95DRAFT_277968, partial [Leptodontidium sp. 2 PMI_412]